MTELRRAVPPMMKANSLSIGAGSNGEVLLHCFAGCEVKRIVEAIGIEMRDLFPSSKEVERRRSLPDARNRATAAGCTLADYARLKHLSIERLREFGLSELTYHGAPAIRILYRDGGGRDLAVQFRVSLDKGADNDGRFRWKSGSKPCLYGLDRISMARARGYVTIVEGASDCHTLWSHGEPALGLPGASGWNEARDAERFDGIDAIYVVIEPDRGGESVLTWLATSRIRDRVRLVSLGDQKDPSALYLTDPEQFPESWKAALHAAKPWTEHEQEDTRAEAEAAWSLCRDLARCPDILERFSSDIVASGLVGELRAAKLVYLVLTSRLLDRPASAAVKGPSSGGKSFVVERTLLFLPPEAFYALTAMSERALAYGTEPLAHRVLVLYEAAGMSGETASYLIRSLLSEGQLRYETVERTDQGLTPRLIEREGPTGLLITTTAASLHPENETRLISIPVTDTREHTRAVLRAIARGSAADIDLQPWHALQTWLTHTECRVDVPFAETLADLIPPVAVRLRRDFGQLLTLVKAHALLHRATRTSDTDGTVVASIADYEAVRGLVADLIADGLGATVALQTRETVEAVKRLTSRASHKDDELDPTTTTILSVANELKLDKSTAWRRVQVAIRSGFLRNLETRKGQPARLSLGEPMPDDVPVLPSVEKLAAVFETGCTVARDWERFYPPFLPTSLRPRHA